MIDWVETNKELPPIGRVVLLWWDGNEQLNPIMCSGTITPSGNKYYWYARGRHYSLVYAPYWAYINAPEGEDGYAPVPEYDKGDSSQ